MWLVDNNVPRQVTQLLRDLGHDVLEVREVLTAGAPGGAFRVVVTRRAVRCEGGDE